jgi:preprotein translocase subunit SecA
VRQFFTRLHYIYLGGEILRNSDNGSLEDEVLEHLQQAQEAQRSTWGESERVRLNADPSNGQVGTAELGHRVQTQIYRQVLLGAITELWVDYLTRVEALRVSVGLEAYAQQDPLVKYKSQASEMFQTLLADIRAAVIGRIFLYQPRAAAPQAEAAAGNGRRLEQAEEAGPAAAIPAQAGANQAQGSGKKRKRHRH